MVLGSVARILEDLTEGIVSIKKHMVRPKSI